MNKNMRVITLFLTTEEIDKIRKMFQGLMLYIVVDFRPFGVRTTALAQLGRRAPTERAI